MYLICLQNSASVWKKMPSSMRFWKSVHWDIWSRANGKNAIVSPLRWVVRSSDALNGNPILLLPSLLLLFLFCISLFIYNFCHVQCTDHVFLLHFHRYGHWWCIKYFFLVAAISENWKGILANFSCSDEFKIGVYSRCWPIIYWTHTFMIAVAMNDTSYHRPVGFGE